MISCEMRLIARSMSEPDNKIPIYFSFAASLDGSLKESPYGSRGAVDIENHENPRVANLPL
jgi:hypothetical protein